MAQKDLKLSALFDYYSPLLSEKHREAFDYYYNDDLSLSEIAEIMGMTRQGARSLINSVRDKLSEFESALNFAKISSDVDKLCKEALKVIDEAENVNADESLNKIGEIIIKIQNELQ